MLFATRGATIGRPYLNHRMEPLEGMMTKRHHGLFFLRTRKLVSAFRLPLGRRALKCGVAASVEHRAALSNDRFNSVIDIGANRGQFALFSRIAWPDAY